MLPHPRGESDAIAVAFRECQVALHTVRRSEVDGHVADWIERVGQLMDTNDVKDSDGRGTWIAKADCLSTQEKKEFSELVDELAHYFAAQFWEPTQQP